MSRSVARRDAASVLARSGSCAVTTIDAKTAAAATTINAKSAKNAKDLYLFVLRAPCVPTYVGSGFSRTLEERFAIDIPGYRQSKVLQYRRRDVDDLGVVGRRDRLRRDERARRRLVVERPVVAGPLFHVRIHEAGRRAAERRLPRDAIAVGQTDLQFGGIADVLAAIDV